MAARLLLACALAAAVPAVLLASGDGAGLGIVAAPPTEPSHLPPDDAGGEPLHPDDVLTSMVPVSATDPGSAPAPVDPSATTPPPDAATPSTTAVTPVSLPVGPEAPVVSRVPTTDRVVFVTIDDGLERDPAVVEFFREHPMPSSLFLVQSAAAAGEDFFRQLQDAGATIHTHTYTHPDLTTVDTATRTNEVCGPLDDFEARFGRRPTLFRPPYGAVDDTVQVTAKGCGYRAVVLWKAATNAGQLQVQEEELQPGDVILLHFRPDLLQNLEMLVDALDAQGFTVGRLEDYLGA